LPESELTGAVERYLADLRLKNASPHTLRNYAVDLMCQRALAALEEFQLARV